MSGTAGAAAGAIHLPDTAAPWPRFWARLLDHQLYLLPLSFATGMAFPDLVENEAFQGRSGDVVLGLLLFPAMLTWDALFIALFGTSVGKALVGLRVADRLGSRLTIAVSLRRNLILYFRGVVLGLPLIWLAGASQGKTDLEANGQTAWDEATDSHVYDVGVNKVRTAIVAMLALAMLVVLQTMSRMAESGY
jgi:uncharacterized RDD family membrane protein YckC